ncbi:hypothetical protein GDO81_013248 [Engystomops pustulosus]|uniref:Uncharacterized protein n=1 Tax=Engystomops pustulosus TaxID=76066 RepID=A0AAV7AYZ4_ENGPU|nr:hypothetical protein GDO81_013248 [Engystomops pustulosus]
MCLGAQNDTDRHLEAHASLCELESWSGGWAVAATHSGVNVPGGWD